MAKYTEYVYEGPKMDLLDKSKWITALLDGSFKQGRKTLCKIPSGRHGGKRTPRHCCLGVLAVLDGGTFALRKGVGSHDGLGYNFRGLEFIDASGKNHGVASMYFDNLPEGGRVICPSLSAAAPPGLETFFAHVNDECGWSFKTIAKWIDANL